VTLYCATTNQGKLREFRLVARPGIEIEPLPGLEEIPRCGETGATFRENAIQKAEHYSRHCSGLLFAEDSGLEVFALACSPGVFSARYAGPGATDADNNRLLLERLGRASDRRARFVCAIALARDGAVVRTFEGEAHGTILAEPRGSLGFGYDPLFYYEPFGCSFGEMPAELKHSVSHRGRALTRLMKYIEDVL
jgi:XTP/dITP diphosphohydrolase